MSLLEQGAAWLASQRDEHMTVEVVYVAGASEATIQATPGFSEFEQQNEDYGILHRSRSHDWLILTADLPYGLPVDGHRVRRTVDGVVYTYEVSSQGDSTPWRYTDGYQKTVRVHTKLISRA